MFSFHIGPYVEKIIDWLTLNFDQVFSGIKLSITAIVKGLDNLLLLFPSYLLILLLALLAWRLSGLGTAIFTILGLLFVNAMGLWKLTVSTISLVISSSLIALLFGVPLGIWAAKNNVVNRILRPILDFMQTMPAFVYLIPAVIFFGMGQVPAVIATVVFAMPPVVRLTNLGIRQVPKDVIEASRSFGSTGSQLLFKVQLPMSIPTILAGINQTIMLSLSMVVISSMIGAGGLGDQVLRGMTQLRIGEGFEAGVAVVILAMVLDRLTQSLGKSKDKR